MAALTNQIAAADISKAAEERAVFRSVDLPDFRLGLRADAEGFGHQLPVVCILAYDAFCGNRRVHHIHFVVEEDNHRVVSARGSSPVDSFACGYVSRPPL